MLFVAHLKYRARRPVAEVIASRLNWKYPENVKVLSETWCSNHEVIMIFETDDAFAINAMTGFLGRRLRDRSHTRRHRRARHAAGTATPGLERRGAAASLARPTNAAVAREGASGRSLAPSRASDRI